MMMWDSRPRYDCPAISKSSCSWTATTNALIPNIKANIAGYVVRRELSKYPNDQIAVEKDLEDARSWFDQKVGASEEAFQRVIQQAEREILQDLQDPKVVEELWQEAARFVAEVFPQPVPKPKEPKAKYVKVGRNEPCPCGSGRKFKKSCVGGAFASTNPAQS
jgi:preprotein translocase subunit SecA